MSTAWKYGNWIAGSWDRLQSGRHILLGIDQWIFRERSEYQEVAIANVPDSGRGLFLDAVVEFLALDEFVYPEHLALPPLLFHPSPKRVLIAGGGDGLALREVLGDPRVEEVVMVELDGLVIDACKAHLKELHLGSFDDARATILVQDVFPYLEAGPGHFDVVIVDLLDAYDALAVSLYDKALRLVKGSLGPGGIVSAYGDLSRPHVAARVPYQCLRSLFDNVAVHQASIDSFGGAYGFLIASDAVDFNDTPTEVVQERSDELRRLRALVPGHFPSCFELPRYVQESLDAELSAPPERLGGTFGWIYPDDPR